MNGGMAASGGGGHMGQMGGQMGVNPMVMGRLPMGPDQVCTVGGADESECSWNSAVESLEVWRGFFFQIRINVSSTFNVRDIFIFHSPMIFTCFFLPVFFLEILLRTRGVNFTVISIRDRGGTQLQH